MDRNSLPSFEKDETRVRDIQSTYEKYYPEEMGKKFEKFDLDSAHVYDMKTFPRGKLIIINVKYFTLPSGISNDTRHGTGRDATGLQQLFLDLGFIVERYDNPTKSEINKALHAAANEDYSELSCFACVFLSHGKEGVIYGTDDFMDIKDLTSMFRTKGLAGKPKLFFFQSCRGLRYMKSYDFSDGPGAGASHNVLDLPVESDFLFCFSTVKEYNSWRNSERGSWFMEILIRVFRNYAHKMDILRMLTLVNSFIVQNRSKTEGDDANDMRQIGSITTQLRKEFFFLPPYGPLS